ncbi:MAG: hypothetical protein AAGM67_09195 [Bacteroidota bacterium]
MDLHDLSLTELIPLLNQFFELEKKTSKLSDGQKLNRNLRRMREQFEALGLYYHNPFGERYDETRTDCEASIAGEMSEDLYITEVLKPIIHYKKGPEVQLLQAGLVIVAAKQFT